MAKEITTKRQLELALGGMCENWRLPIVELKLARNAGTAYYLGPRKLGAFGQIKIVVSLFSCGDGRTAIHDLIHEFAHYLAHCRLGLEPGNTGNHGPVYRQALTDVCKYWYGNPLLYPWDREYKRLRKLGPVGYEQTKEAPTKPDKTKEREQNLERILYRIAKWESKRKRAENALKKLARKKSYLEKVLGGQLVKVSKYEF